MKEIIVLFKTHLDVGFTDFSSNVVKNYMENFIPKAMETARALRGRRQNFIWTTGSWLIEKFLREAPVELREQMEDAIAHGEISWHGLPCTTHTELMTTELFQYGLSLSQKLDQRFGIHTAAAKMTDVPGHTKAMIPALAKAGIRFLHIGVNAASAVPDVPVLFRWRADSGEEIVVMYQDGYGNFAPIPGTDRAICFAHTNDNLGPQSVDQIQEFYQHLQEQYPEADIHAGTLNDAARLVENLKDLPVVTQEIGDSWIHGTGSDPEKVRQYRALLRACKGLPREVTDSVYEHLLLVPEHTWGLDEKTHLGTFAVDLTGEHRYFVRSEFEKARSGEKFRKMESSWEEQRDYVRHAAVQYLEKTGKSGLLPAPVFPDVEGMTELSPEEPVTVGSWQVQINEYGGICSLCREGEILADQDHILGQLEYQCLSAQDYQLFKKSYISHPYKWALEDFGKIGMESADPPSRLYLPRLKHLYRRDNSLTALLSFTGESNERWGAPAEAALTMDMSGRDLKLELVWRKKPANRLPEGLWITFRPFGEQWRISKHGQWIDPTDIVHKGGRKLHATDFGAKNSSVCIASPDAALICPGRPALLHFDDTPVPDDQGVSFNLFNNTWGTNFVMWYDNDASFRFVLSTKPDERR